MKSMLDWLTLGAGILDATGTLRGCGAIVGVSVLFIICTDGLGARLIVNVVGTSEIAGASENWSISASRLFGECVLEASFLPSEGIAMEG